MKGNSYLRHLRWFGFALLLVFAMAATGSQCAKVEDRTTAPDVSLSPSSGGDGEDLDHHGHGGYRECIRDCVWQAQRERALEQIRHQRNLRHCGHDQECIRHENARHRAVMEQIAREERACKAECHQQGEGHGGQ